MTYSFRRDRRLAIASAIGCLVVSIRLVRDYAPLTEGWWHVYARWIDSGKVPYRDFELLTPPGYPYLMWLITNLFGESFLTLRIIGCLMMSAIGVCIHLLVARLSGGYLSVMIAVAAVAYMTSMTAFIAYDYHQVAILGILFGSVVIDRIVNSSQSSPRKCQTAWFVVGVIGGFIFSIKQTHGALAILGFASLTILIRGNQAISRLRSVAMYALGIVAFWIPILFFFTVAGILPNELYAEFWIAGGSKGGILQSLVGWTTPELAWPAPLQVVMRTAFLFVVIACIGRVRLSGDSKESSDRSYATTFAALFVPPMLFQWSSLDHVGTLMAIGWNEFVKNRQYGSALVVLVGMSWTYFHTVKHATRQSVLILGVCASAIYFAGAFSSGVSVNSDFITVAIAIALLSQLIQGHVTKIVIVGAVCSVIASGSYWLKVNEVPYSWWKYETPKISELNTSFSDGLMRGLRTNSETKTLYITSRSYLDSGRSCPGEIVMYPHIPLLLLDVGATPGGRTAQYWYDFTSQPAIEQETSRMKQVNIKSLAILMLPDAVVSEHEAAFFGSRPVAQRKLLEVLNEKSSQMQLVVTQTLPNDVVFYLFVSSCVVEQYSRANKKHHLSTPSVSDK